MDLTEASLIRRLSCDSTNDKLTEEREGLDGSGDCGAPRGGNRRYGENDNGSRVGGRDESTLRCDLAQ